MSVKNREETNIARGQQAGESSRRAVLGVSGLLAAAGLLWTPKPASAQQPGGRGAGLVVDVACLGHTFAPNSGGVLAPPNGPNRGVSFYVEGALYPAGTIPPGVGFDPASAMSIGHWLCRGWFMNTPDRPAPGAITTQEYLLGVIDSADNPSPMDTLVSSGLAGGALEFTRAVIGGSGRYSDARGDVLQETIGQNTTVLTGLPVNAPNFRFYFNFANGG